jgi:hypothetical protein
LADWGVPPKAVRLFAKKFLHIDRRDTVKVRQSAPLPALECCGERTI